MYKIVEIFKSIQSEGTHGGTAAQFIRFYGCNLQCDFGDGFKCDEPLHTQKTSIVEMVIEDVMDKLEGGPRHIVITGGEPSLYDLKSLIDVLQMHGYYVQVETNGTKWDNISNADFITYSPKFAWDKKAPHMKAGFHELKLLAGPNMEPKLQKWASVRNKYIQPIADGDTINIANVKWCHDFVVNNPGWKLSLQVHKWYGAE